MWIYIAGEATQGASIKIGKTKGTSPLERLISIDRDQHNHDHYVLLAAMRGPAFAEDRLHEHFAEHRQDRGPRTEYFNAAEPLIEYVLWLRLQFFVAVDPTTTPDELPEEDPNHWLPRPDRRIPRPPTDPEQLFANYQATGPLAATKFDWMPDPFASYQDYFTPTDVVARAWEAMGGIDLDAASHFLANRRLAQAGIRIPEYFTAAHSAFEFPWRSRVWLNPPYGDYLPWFDRAAEEMKAGRTTQLCMISPLWAFATRQAQPYMAQARAMIVLSPTPSFFNPGDPKRTGTNQPHAIVYWGPQPDAFLDVFADIGVPTIIDNR